MNEYIPIILALIGSIPGIVSIWKQAKKDQAELTTKREEIQSKNALDDANASKIMSETMRSVIESLRSEMQNQDNIHAIELRNLRAELNEERTSRVKAEERLDLAMEMITQLQAQIRQLGGTPPDIPISPIKKKKPPR